MLILRYGSLAIVLACFSTAIALRGLDSPLLPLGIWGGLVILLVLRVFKVTAEEIAIFFLPLVMLSLTALTGLKPLYFTTLWLAFLLYSWAIRKTRTGWATKPVQAAYLLPFIVIAVLTVFSVILNPIQDLTLGSLLQTLALGPTYWLLVQMLGASNLRRLLGAFLLGCVAGALVFLIAFGQGSPLIALAAIPYGLGRAWVLDMNPNSWAIYPLLGLPIAAGLWTYGSRRWIQRLWLWPAALLLIGVLALTLSRSAMLGIAVGLMFLLAARSRGRRILAVSFSLLGVSLLLWSSGLLKILDPVLRVHSGLSGRAGVWQMALDNIERNPLFGIGFGSFQNLAFFRAPFTENGLTMMIDLPTTHNAFLAIATEIGVPAMLIALAIFPLFFYRTHFLWPKVKGGPEGVILITCSSIMAAGFARALFESDFILPHAYLYENLPLILMLALQDLLYYREFTSA